MSRVSICIPTYNQALYVEQAILSALQQTISPLEIIVADDCSTDNTLEVLLRLAAEIPILTIIQQPKNTGITQNTNTCLRAASGDFIIRLDSDDYLSPNYTQKLVELFQQYPEAGYAHAGVQEIDQNGGFLKVRRLARNTGYQLATDALKAAIKGYRVAANIIMFRRTALQYVGFISTKLNFAEDYHLSASLAAAGFGNIYSNEILSYYRIWVDTGKVRQRRKLTEIVGLRSVFEEVIEPAYLKLGWDSLGLTSSKTAFACTHADCLGWDIYSNVEKAELISELKRLSTSPALEYIIWLQLNGLGWLPNSYRIIKSWPKSIIKKGLFYLKTKTVL